jgi:hypothetical protein
MVFNGINLKFDFVDFISKLEHPEDINHLINDTLNLLLSVDVNNSVRLELKKILLSGQTNEKYWTDAWKDFNEAKANEDHMSVISTRLEPFFKKIFSLPEFQMI